MDQGLKRLVEKLHIINGENAAADSFQYLCAKEFPKEYENLISELNTAIEVGETRTKQERNNLDMINDIIRSGMWSMEFDKKGEIQKVIWSQNFREMLGYKTTEEFPDLLESWVERLHPEDRDATLKAYWSTVAGKQNYDVKYRMLTKTDGYRWFRATGEVARREDKTPILFIGTFIDITQEKENERLAQEKNVAQQALEMAKNELERQNDILRALCSDYVSVYRTDLNTELYEAYRITESMRDGVRDTIAASEIYYSSAIQHYINEFVAEEDQEYFRAMTDKEYVYSALKKRKSFFFRYRVKENPQGMENFEALFAKARGLPGEFAVIIGFRNIDLAVRKEDAYKKETQHDIEETLEGSRTGIWTIECEEGCEPRMYADKTMRMLLGVEEYISPEDCYKTWFERIEPDYVEVVQEVVGQILEQGRSEVIYPWNHPKLGMIYVRCGGVADSKFDKAGYRLKGYHQDITETMVTRQKQEKALLEALVEAKRANLAKTEFLSHMSHDIRTPINGILGMLAISEKVPENEEKQRECKAKIRTCAEHLLSLINDVLDISKLESGAFVFAKERFYLQDVLESYVEIMIPQAQEQGITLETKQIALTHTALTGSPLHLRQILINIVGNAIKYNRPNGKINVCTEELSATNEHVTYQFTIEDSGIGMSDDFQKRIFEPFTQEQNDARTCYRGTGLGMAITKSLVEQMGGAISVQSRLGVGSRFIVTIPIERADEEEEIVRPAEEGHADVSGMRVLLVEDNEINREIAQYMLEDAGVTVINAENGRQAVENYLSSKVGEFDCILMDVMMPVMDGLEAARRIRQTERQDAKTIPIIALSANAFAEDAQLAKDAGMNEHLPKPLDMEEVFHVMASYRRRPS